MLQNIRLGHAVGMGIAGALVLAAAAEDSMPPMEPWTDVPVMIDSGPVAAAAGTVAPTTLFETVVHAPGASWVRLVFAPSPATVLSGDPAASNASVLRITSLADGAVQRLDGEHLGYWNFTSAYFNGDAVRVELLGAAGTDASRVVVFSVMAGPAAPVVDRSICQSVDDRVLSFDARTGRLMTVGCTGWLINDQNSMFLSAGHCGISSTSVMQFNVPLSTSTGTAQNPPPEDQYPVDLTSLQGTGSGVGNDWRYFGCMPNSNTGLTAFQRQQARHVLAAAAPAADGRPIRITGYGTVSSPVSPTWRLVQKTHVGPYMSQTGTAVRYHTDTTGGNSGSPVIDEDNNVAIGIHTHGGCTTSATSSNAGTAINHPSIQAALASPLGICRTGRGLAGGGVFASGDLANNFGTVDVTTGGFAKVSEIATVMQGLAYDALAGVLRGIDRNGVLHEIDPVTGAAVAGESVNGIGGMVNGLAFDAQSNTLYGMIQSVGQLVRINIATGLLTAVGAAQGGNVGAIEIDASTGTLFGIDDTAPGSRLVSISTVDGTRTVIGALGAGAVDCNGLAWSEADGSLYTINASDEQLLQVDALTGAATVVGSTGGLFGAAFGMAAVVSAPPACVADFDQSGSVDVQDLFDFLAAWFGGNPAADVDGNTGLSVGDIFAFLEFFFAGCA